MKRIAMVVYSFYPNDPRVFREAEALTENNDKLRLNIAANYGGRWDIVNSVNQFIAQHKGEKRITEEELEANLSTNQLPDLDLLIRTGGETRISNFLIWQAAYAELFFTDVLWPDFDEAELEKAIESFSSRQRRFGKTGEQVEAQ